MSSIRKAHTVEIIDRRLRDAEVEGNPDPMELISLHDELSRVERKWLEKQTRIQPPTSRSRPLANAPQLNTRFEKLTRLIAAALRQQAGTSSERQLLQATAVKLQSRSPLPTPAPE